MYSFSNISSVAKYESILLKRSWFYRIFLVLAVLFFFVFNFVALVNKDNAGLWIMRALTSNIPYLNLLFLNTGQAIIAVFLSSEFLKADKKLDTSEVFYVHPLSNAEYVFGKILGNLNVFVQLNLIVMALVVTLNFVAGVTVDWLAYVTYFLLISVPTLIYIFGLSIGLMLIIKNQAITFVLLLGYIALTLFYVGDKFYYLFDYMAYSLPLVKSSIVGFTNWSVLINHRLMYVLIGLGFICISIFLFRRLPNTKYGRYRWLVLSFCFIFCGLTAGYNHVNTFLHASKMRTLYTEINNKYVNSPQMVIERYEIKVEQHPQSISATAVMQATSQEASSVFTFSLNPSLRIGAITENGNDLTFTREHQIILIDFGRFLEKGDTATFEVAYSGRIDENFCYLDIPTELLEEKRVVESFFNIDKRYSFQTENYVLFTPETYWYPRPGVAFSSENPDWQKSYFSNYRLEVKTINGLQALSQGTRKHPAEKVPAIRSNEFNSNEGGGFRPMVSVMRMGGGGPPMGGRMGGMSGIGGGQGGQNVQVRQSGPGGPGGPGGQVRQGGAGGQVRQGERGGQQVQGDGERGARMREGGGERLSPEMRDSMMAVRMREGGGERMSPEMRDSMMAVRMREGGGERMSPEMRDSMMAVRIREGGGERSPRMREGGDSIMPRIREGGDDLRAQGRPPSDEGEFRGQGGARGGQQVQGDGEQRRPPPVRESGDSIIPQMRDVLAEVSTETPTPVDSIFIFETDFPTPGISLIIGDYEQKCIEVDHTIFSIWHLRGNDYFTAAFDTIADTIPSQIRIRRQALESQFSLNYSFKRFSIVEAPLQFSGYVRAWTQAQEMMQPEMVLFPEKGAIFNNLDVARQIHNQKRWARRQGRELTDIGAALMVFNNLLMTFQNAENRGDFSMERGSVNVTTVANPYFVFPQLYNFRYNIYSSELPVANRLIEVYLQELADNPWTRQMNGISDNEKANLLIQQRPFKELLSDPEHRDLLSNIISLKANVLFAPAERNIGNTEFRNALRTFLYENRFTNISFARLLEEMSLIAEEDLITPLATWDAPTNLPVYIVGTPQVTNIINRDVEVFVVRLQITNDSDYDGIINVETLFGGGGFGGGGGRGGAGGGGGGGGGAIFTFSAGSITDDPRAKRKISLAARETKVIVTVWEDAPRAINVNTLISANLPNLINIPLTNIARERNISIDEEGDFILANVNHTAPGEVIVDNEDTRLFELSQPDNVGLLPMWLDRIGDDSFRYSGVQNWRPPLHWTLTTNDKYFGTHVRSAYVIKSGNGSQTATWKVPVPSRGLYDLYYHVFTPEEVRRGGQQNTRGGGRANTGTMEYQFSVKYDNGEDNAFLNLRRAEEGWNRIGAYYFTDDTIKVVLSNKISNVRMITADAVKIVRRESSSAVGELIVEN